MKTTEKIKKNKDKAKLKMREKIAIACFMEGLPSLISLWREKAPEKTFDAWLWEVYEFQKKITRNSHKVYRLPYAMYGKPPPLVSHMALKALGYIKKQRKE